MAESENEQERPCLHCLMVELIDDSFAKYPPAPGGSDKVDTEETDEIIEAVAKTVAELTSRQDACPTWSADTIRARTRAACIVGRLDQDCRGSDRL
jgi:hypothetical protein